jgi:hypothetical protein
MTGVDDHPVARLSGAALGIERGLELRTRAAILAPHPVEARDHQRHQGDHRPGARRELGDHHDHGHHPR